MTAVFAAIFSLYGVCAVDGGHWMPMMGDNGWASLYMAVFYVLLILLLLGLVISVYLWILKLWKSMGVKRQE